MPIKPENKGRYPRDWKAISLRIREREGQCCKFCKAPNYELIYRPDKTSQWVLWPEGMESEALSMDGYKPVKVILTVAHLNHQPEDCSDDNLAALCQKCHLNYDALHHKANARQTLNNKRKQLQLF
jgi:hypothetical protein